jgi:hypothetical protein
VRGRRARAFTLLEVMAVVMILGFIFLVMGKVFKDIASTTTDASRTETTRRGLLLLDRVAGDLEGATLVVKPEATDPLQHPWLFYADSRLARNGADRLKFDTRTAPGPAEHATDLAVVAYWAERGDDDDLRLLRWTSPALPEGLDRDFPNRDDPGVQVVATGLSSFALRFSDDKGNVVSAWDSSTLERSSQLPLAAEIDVGLRDESAPEGGVTFSRTVLLPLRPFDLEKALAGKQEDEDEQDEDSDKDEDCVTVAACRAANASAFAAAIAARPEWEAILNAASTQCWDDFEAANGFDAPVDCH